MWTVRDDPPTRVVGPVIDIPTMPLARIVGDDEIIDAPIHSLLLHAEVEEIQTRTPPHTYNLRSLANDGSRGGMIINVCGRYYHVLVGSEVRRPPSLEDQDQESDEEVGQCWGCNNCGPIGCRCSRDACADSYLYLTIVEDEVRLPRSDDSV